VNFSVVQDVNNPVLRTTRERVNAHLNDEECASCHKKTDPPGLGLEKFDGVGQFRAMENNAAIDATGDLDKTAFNGAAELGAVMAKSPAVASCLVQSTYRYATGHSIEKNEQTTIDYYEQLFLNNGYRFVDLMRAIAQSPDFYSMSAVTAQNTDSSKAEKSS